MERQGIVRGRKEPIDEQKKSLSTQLHVMRGRNRCGQPGKEAGSGPRFGEWEPERGAQEEGT